MSLGPSLQGLTGTRVQPNANSASARWREAVTEWMHSLRLSGLCVRLTATARARALDGTAKKWTHQNSLKVGNISWTSYWCRMGSDHRPIDAALRLEHREIWSTVDRNEYSQQGWSTKTEEAKPIFMKGVAKDLCWMNDEARGEALLLVEEIIYSHAVGTDPDNMAIRQWRGLQEHRKRFADLRNTLRQEAARDICNGIRREIREELSANLRMVKGEQLN